MSDQLLTNFIYIRFFSAIKIFEYVKDLLYEGTLRKVLAPAVNCDFYGPKTEHSHVDSESEVYGNFIRFSSVRAKFNF